MVSGRVLDTESLDANAQSLSRHKDDRTVLVRKWITDVRFNASKNMMRMSRDGKLEDEAVQQWKLNNLTAICNQKLGDVEMRNVCI